MADTGSALGRWRLVAKFDDQATQAQNDPEMTFPNDAVSRFVGELTERWGLTPEDLSENSIVQFTDERVTAWADNLDQLVDPTHWLLMSTIPVTISIDRMDAS